MTTVSAPVEIPLLRRPAVRWGLGFVAFIVALNLLAVAIGSFLPAPSGPAASSYATSSRGLAAYAELLSKLGHPVTRLRETPDRAELDPRSTVVLLDPQGDVGPQDVAALRNFAAAGGRVVAGGADTAQLATALAGTTITWTPDSAAIVRGSSIPGVRRVVTDGAGRYDCSLGEGRALVGVPRGAVVCSVGGRIVLLSDSSPLTNQLLGRADNAALGAVLAGAAGRPVVFAETVHGYNAATGLAALPAEAWWALGLLGLAGVVFLVARWPRLGPAVAAGDAPAPPRRAHVDAVASSLARAGDAAPAAARLRSAARTVVTRRAGLPPDCGGEPLRRASLALGLSDEEAALLISETARGDDLVGLGRLLAKLRSEGT